MRLIRVLCLPTVSFLFAASLGAQTADWNNVKSIAPGTEILIARAGADSVRGQMQSASDDSISISSGPGQQSISRAQVARISVRKKSHRGRHALIGLAIGAGGGAAIGAATYSPCAGFGCIFNPSRGAFTAAVAAGGGLIGAGIGALMPSGGWREVYRQ